MRVIVIGGGKMVYFLAKQFASRGYQLTIVNADPEEATGLSRQLKATVVLGLGGNPATLEEAGARRADVVLSLTPHDEDNLIACQLAQKMFGVPHTVALVNDPDNEEIFRQLGITTVFSASRIIANLIEQQTGFEDVRNLASLARGRLNVTEIVLQEGAPAANQSLQEIELPEGALIACIIRDEEIIVPGGGSRLQVADRLILITHPENFGRALRALSGDEA